MEFNFGDDLFAEEKCRERLSNGSEKYVPKQCTEKWYWDTIITSNSSVDEYHQLKYQADIFFCDKEYEKALIKYKERYSYLTPKNHALLRENCESVIRCCLKLDMVDEAVEWTNKMIEGSNNPADSSTHYLAYTVYMAANQGPEKLLHHLLKAISVNPWYPIYWHDFYRLLKGLFESGQLECVIMDRIVPITVEILYIALLRSKNIITDSQKGRNVPLNENSALLLKKIEAELTSLPMLAEGVKEEIETKIRRIPLVEVPEGEWLKYIQKWLCL